MKKLAIPLLLLLAGFHIQAQQPRLVFPIGILYHVWSVSYSPDGELITTVEHKSLKIWSASTGKLLSELKDSSDLIDAQFQADSKKILAVSGTDTLRIIDAATAEILSVIKTGKSHKATRFSPDGNWILICSYDDQVQLWNTSSKKVIRNLELEGELADLGFSRGGERYYVSDQSGNFRMYDINTPGPILHLKKESAIKISYTRDGDKMLFHYGDSLELWQTREGNLVRLQAIRPPMQVKETRIHPDGSKFVALSPSSIYVYNFADPLPLFHLKYKPANYGNDLDAHFSPDGKRIIVKNRDTFQMRDVQTGALLYQLEDELTFRKFSPDSRFVLALARYTQIPVILDVRNGRQITSLKGYTSTIISQDVSLHGNRALLQLGDRAKLFNANTGQLTHSYTYARMSPDRTHILAISNDSTVMLLDAETGKIRHTIPAFKGEHTLFRFSHDSKKILSIFNDDNVRIWDIESASLEKILPIGDTVENHNIDISPDYSKLLTGSSADGQVRVWDLHSGKLMHTLDLEDFVAEAQFHPNGKTILTLSSPAGENPSIWDVNTGARLREHLIESNSYIVISPDRSKIIVAEYAKPTVLLDASTGELLRQLNYEYSGIKDLDFSENGKELLVATRTGKLVAINIATGEEQTRSPVETRYFPVRSFTSDGNYFISVSSDYQKMERWDVKAHKRLFSFFAVDSNGYLVTDDAQHYDGSDDARKLLYFTCGREIIELDQVKDQLWVPNLAERLLNGDSIRARTLDELDICGLTPEVQEAEAGDGAYAFTIRPRRGGLGETILFVNGIEAQRYAPGDLKRTQEGYELRIQKKALAGFFITGSENTVSVKAYTADNSISSRGFGVRQSDTTRSLAPPNLFAVIVGVSDYKGEDLDLQYAAKDANDISAALGTAARKLLNIDGKEHVFIYNLTTLPGQQVPEKKSIQKVLEEIGSRATPNDILLIFFSGHGVMATVPGADDKSKQFYFLTADASRASANDAVDVVGISTAELGEWMKPQRIRAQKRILLFDACNSGQSIRDFVKLGKPEDGYIAGKNDEKVRQIRELDKLNEKAGLYILAASASDQLAYEYDKYSQGLLTWALLKAIKQQPDILEEGRYLNVGRWFSAAEKTVSEEGIVSGARQQPQVVTTTNFNIGVVDDEVKSAIVLAQEKAVITPSIFINRDLADDNLELSGLINNELAAVSALSNSRTLYFNNSNSPGAFSLTGSYQVKGSNITVTVNVKQNRKIIHSFEVKGRKDKLEALVKQVVERMVVVCGQGTVDGRQ